MKVSAAVVACDSKAPGMYGLVNKALQEMLEKQRGTEVWTQIRMRAGIEDDVFISLDAYPDDLTYRLVAATCEVTGRNPPDVLHDFGCHWVLETAAEHYGHLLRASGRSFRDFLLALPNFHARVSLMMPRLVPPEFAADQVGENHIILHYWSTRDGLVPFVEGLIQGLAKLYQVSATATVLAELSQGSGHSAIDVVWQQREVD